MRKSTLITIAVIIVGGAVAWLALNAPWDPKRAVVEKLTSKFLDDLRFKDFRSSSLYHHPLARKRLDMGRAFEELFIVKPESLDIMDYRLIKTEFDGDRALVKVGTRYKILNKDKKPRENEFIVYWLKRHPDCPDGGSCNAGACVDEAGKTIIRTPESEEGPNRKPEEKHSKGDKTVNDPNAETWTCDATKEKKWFMNVDSTINSKNRSITTRN